MSSHVSATQQPTALAEHLLQVSSSRSQGTKGHCSESCTNENVNLSNQNEARQPAAYLEVQPDAGENRLDAAGCDQRQMPADSQSASSSSNGSIGVATDTPNRCAFVHALHQTSMAFDPNHHAECTIVLQCKAAVHVANTLFCTAGSQNCSLDTKLMPQQFLHSFMQVIQSCSSSTVMTNHIHSAQGHLEACRQGCGGQSQDSRRALVVQLPQPCSRADSGVLQHRSP